MAVGPDLGQGALLPDEWIVEGRGALLRDPQDLADMRAEVLGQGTLRVPLAGRHEQVAVGRENEARTEMVIACELRPLAKDHGNVRQPAGVEPGARDRGSVGVAIARFRVRKIDDGVPRESGIQDHVEKAALVLGVHGRNVRDRFRQRPVLAHSAQSPGPLGHEHPPVRQECEPPGVFEPAREGGHRHLRIAARGDVRRILAGSGARDQERKEQAA